MKAIEALGGDVKTEYVKTMIQKKIKTKYFKIVGKGMNTSELRIRTLRGWKFEKFEISIFHLLHDVFLDLSEWKILYS